MEKNQKKIEPEIIEIEEKVVEKIDSALTKRTKSFLWRTGMMGLAAILGILADNIGILQFSPAITAMVGLFLGEVSKAVSKVLNTSMKKTDTEQVDLVNEDELSDEEKRVTEEE